MHDLSRSYTESEFLGLIDHLVPGFVADKQSVVEDIEHFQDVISLGVSNQLDDLRVFAVRVSGSINKRVSIANSSFRLMKNTGTYKALVAFYADDTDQWRLSLLTAEPLIRDGEVVTSFSNPRRYSYVLGPKSKLATPTKWLVTRGGVSDFDELLGRFAIEVVNKEFYKGIADLYDDLVGANGSEPAIKHPGDGAIVHHFAVRLIGRIIFCWFLREKKSITGIPLLPKEVLSREAAGSDNYYNRTLAPLFFDILNKHPDERHDDHIVAPFDGIPYVNGGLFDPKDDHYEYDTKLDKYDPDAVNIPDEWLRKLLDLLEMYNFTVDENTSYDIELSIDPEMLGRIFENLLATINPETQSVARKETGSFYTPREIVEYMVDESLFSYLSQQTNITEPKLRALISYNLLDDDEHPLTQDEQDWVVDALSKMRILDPACGSGAFPIGILQKMVFMLDRVDPKAEKWFDKQLGNVSHELRRHLQSEFERHNFDYLRKMGVIRESIYGVDIQPVAIEISRLRCFLTLIVDQSVDDDKPNRGIHPLPNLDFKFVVANTLVPLNGNGGHQNGSSMFDDDRGISRLQEIRDDYFSSHGHKREKLTIRFIATQNDMLREIIKANSKYATEKTQKISSWNPFVHDVSGWFDAETMFGLRDGFSIVIGNPPYVQVRRGIYPTKSFPYAEGKDKGKQNLYKLFIECAYNLLGADGVACLIVQSSIMCDLSSGGTRELLMEKGNIHKIAEFPKTSPDKVFKSVIQGTAVIIYGRFKFANPEVINVSYGNSLQDVGFFVFHPLDKSKIQQLFPHRLSFPLASSRELELMSRIAFGSGPLVDLGVSYRQGDINLTIDKSHFGPHHSGVPMLRGKDISAYKISTEYEEFMERGYKKDVSDRNGSRCILVGQNVTGTTDRKRIIFALANHLNVIYGHSVNKLYVGDLTRSKLIMAILNSKLIDWYFRKTSTNNHVNGYELEVLPISNMYENYIGSIVPLVDEILETHDDLVLNRLDQMVYEMYSLSESDIKVVKDGLRCYP